MVRNKLFVLLVLSVMVVAGTYWSPFSQETKLAIQTGGVVFLIAVLLALILTYVWNTSIKADTRLGKVLMLIGGKKLSKSMSSCGLLLGTCLLTIIPIVAIFLWIGIFINIVGPEFLGLSNYIRVRDTPSLIIATAIAISLTVLYLSLWVEQREKYLIRVAWGILLPVLFGILLYTLNQNVDVHWVIALILSIIIMVVLGIILSVLSFIIRFVSYKYNSDKFKLYRKVCPTIPIASQTPETTK